jgi:DegV family protein with EDD domain
MTIKIVTDSSSDIPWDYAEKKDITVVPLVVTYENKVFKENKTFNLDNYYQKFKSDKDFLPKTSQPAPKDFHEVFKEAAEKGIKDIIVITISSAMSGTINSARLAAEVVQEQFSDLRVHLVDSLNASYSEVFLVEEALNLQKEGLPADEIVQRLNNLVPLIKTFIFIPTLKYLHAGGRISLAKYLLASLLKRKVITKVNSAGTNETAKVVSNYEQAIDELISLTTNGKQIVPRKVAIVHAHAEEDAKQLLAKVKDEMPDTEVRLLQTGCTISAHTGPNAVALISDFGNLLDEKNNDEK